MLKTRLQNFVLLGAAMLCYLFLSGCSSTPVQQNSNILTLTQSVSIEKIDRLNIETIPVTHIESMKVAKLPELKIDPYIDPKDIKCIADTLYAEARGEGRKGMLAVGFVIKNRTLDERFPNTVCGVVHEGKYVRGKPVKNQCQFSWVCDGLPEKVTDKVKYEEAKELARLVILEQANNPVGKSLFFHAVYVKPQWKRYRVTYKVGRHIFYA